MTGFVNRNERPEMMIFHEPDVLEFAADGKSLGKFRVNCARELALHVASPETTDIGVEILAVYDEVLKREEVAKLAAADAGFERRVPQ
ncbi:MAG: hypothetical protein COB78_05820 [Hyphomicrobiales bacterium]|nr:MAG: hypothetical protein COB78_05820 [Hyphomicrobiales bacterium]